MSIRVASKAVILREGKVLLNSAEFGNGTRFHALPGGGQELYESMEAAVVRECLEETGYTVEPVRLAAIYEEIILDPDFIAKAPSHAHKIFNVFICEIASDVMIEPSNPDSRQLGVEWVDVGNVGLLLPKAIRDRFADIITSPYPIYLGTHIRETID